MCRPGRRAFRGARADLAACGALFLGEGRLWSHAMESQVVTSACSGSGLEDGHCRFQQKGNQKAGWEAGLPESQMAQLSPCKLSPGLPRLAAQAVPPRGPWGEEGAGPRLCLTSLSDP